MPGVELVHGRDAFLVCSTTQTLDAFSRRGAVTAYYVCLSTEDALSKRRKLHRLYANLPFTTIWDDCAVTAESPRHNLVAETYSCARESQHRLRAECG